MIKNNPKLTVIIPTYNEEKNIGDALKSLEYQSHKNLEIVVVDDGSTDKTLEIVKAHKKVKILKQKHGGPGRARNLGAKKARGEILIFVDADMTFDKDYLKYLIEPIIHGETIGTEEEIQIAKNADYNIWSRCLGKVLSDPRKKERMVFRAILKKKFIELGGFDPKYGYADDQTFLFKYGVRPLVAKRAICYHDNPGTLKAVYKQARWIGSSSLQRWLEFPVINWIFVAILIVLSPAAIILLAIRKAVKTKNLKILIPWMIIFTCVRYFGTIAGYKRKILTRENAR